MTIREIAETLDATWLCCEEEGDRVLRTAFASDMMSDVLACVTEDTLLLTGLVNGQCVRTCEMLDVPCVVFVRSKEPLPYLQAAAIAAEAASIDSRRYAAGQSFRPDGTRIGEDPVDAIYR